MSPTVLSHAQLNDAWDRIDVEAKDAYPEYVPALTASRGNPKLSRLYPFLGVAGLCFSLVDSYPFFVDVAIAHVEDEVFAVQVGTGDGGWAIMTSEHEGDVESCVKVASETLPEDYGPAIKGDANAWRRYVGIPEAP